MAGAGEAAVGEVDLAVGERDVLVWAHAGGGDDLAAEHAGEHGPGDAGDGERHERVGGQVGQPRQAHAQH
ncbi:MAG: hypothetical protein IPL61_06560 [Myxococcales bacterium]|nr:hypothetical protein [Myxococcales bacterium]